MSEEFKDAGIAVNALWPQTGMQVVSPKDTVFSGRKDRIKGSKETDPDPLKRI